MICGHVMLYSPVSCFIYFLLSLNCVLNCANKLMICESDGIRDHAFLNVFFCIIMILDRFLCVLIHIYIVIVIIITRTLYWCSTSKGMKNKHTRWLWHDTYIQYYKRFKAILVFVRLWNGNRENCIWIRFNWVDGMERD